MRLLTRNSSSWRRPRSTSSRGSASSNSTGWRRPKVIRGAPNACIAPKASCCGASSSNRPFLLASSKPSGAIHCWCKGRGLKRLPLPLHPFPAQSPERTFPLFTASASSSVGVYLRLQDHSWIAKCSTYLCRNLRRKSGQNSLSNWDIASVPTCHRSFFELSPNVRPSG